MTAEVANLWRPGPFRARSAVEAGQHSGVRAYDYLLSAARAAK
jgi:hypothetical protein